MMPVQSQIPSKLTVPASEHRSQLYYGQYEYRAKFRIRGLHKTRYNKTFAHFQQQMDDRINNRDSLFKADRAFIKLLRAEYAQYDLAAIERYYTWLDEHKEHTANCMLRLEGDTMTVFSNDRALLATLNTIVLIGITQALVTVAAGVLEFDRQPKHQYRVYFRERTPGLDKIQEIGRFLTTNQDTLFPSPATSRHITGEGHGRWTWYRDKVLASHYIEYDDEGMLLLMTLAFGKYLGKTYRLEKRIAKS